MSPTEPTGPTDDDTTEATPAALIATLRGRGMSQGEIAKALDRSPRMIRAVERGDKPGHGYRDALAQLVDRGRITSPPPRRRSAVGQLVPVRAPLRARTATAATGQAATGTPDKAPTVTPTERPAKRPRGRFDMESTYMPNGARHHLVQVPLKGRQGQAKGKAALVDIMRSIAKGQAHGTRRIVIRAGLAGGKTAPIGEKGGYRASTMLRNWHEAGDDPMAWVKAEIAHRANYDTYIEGDDDVMTIEIIDPGPNG